LDTHGWVVDLRSSTDRFTVTQFSSTHLYHTHGSRLLFYTWVTFCCSTRCAGYLLCCIWLRFLHLRLRYTHTRLRSGPVYRLPTQHTHTHTHRFTRCPHTTHFCSTFPHALHLDTRTHAHHVAHTPRTTPVGLRLHTYGYGSPHTRLRLRFTCYTFTFGLRLPFCCPRSVLLGYVHIPTFTLRWMGSLRYLPRLHTLRLRFTGYVYHTWVGHVHHLIYSYTTRLHTHTLHVGLYIYVCYTQDMVTTPSHTHHVPRYHTLVHGWLIYTHILRLRLVPVGLHTHTRLGWLDVVTFTGWDYTHIWFPFYVTLQLHTRYNVYTPYIHTFGLCGWTFGLRWVGCTPHTHTHTHGLRFTHALVRLLAVTVAPVDGSVVTTHVICGYVTRYYQLVTRLRLVAVWTFTHTRLHVARLDIPLHTLPFVYVRYTRFTFVLFGPVAFPAFTLHTRLRTHTFGCLVTFPHTPHRGWLRLRLRFTLRTVYVYTVCRTVYTGLRLHAHTHVYTDYHTLHHTRYHLLVDRLIHVYTFICYLHLPFGYHVFTDWTGLRLVYGWHDVTFDLRLVTRCAVTLRLVTVTFTLLVPRLDPDCRLRIRCYIHVDLGWIPGTLYVGLVTPVTFTVPWTRVYWWRQWWASVLHFTWWTCEPCDTRTTHTHTHTHTHTRFTHVLYMQVGTTRWIATLYLDSRLGHLGSQLDSQLRSPFGYLWTFAPRTHIHTRTHTYILDPLVTHSYSSYTVHVILHLLPHGCIYRYVTFATLFYIHCCWLHTFIWTLRLHPHIPRLFVDLFPYPFVFIYRLDTFWDRLFTYTHSLRFPIGNLPVPTFPVDPGLHRSRLRSHPIGLQFPQFRTPTHTFWLPAVWLHSPGYVYRFLLVTLFPRTVPTPYWLGPRAHTLRDPHTRYGLVTLLRLQCGLFYVTDHRFGYVYGCYTYYLLYLFIYIHTFTFTFHTVTVFTVTFWVRYVYIHGCPFWFFPTHTFGSLHSSPAVGYGYLLHTRLDLHVPHTSLLDGYSSVDTFVDGCWRWPQLRPRLVIYSSDPVYSAVVTLVDPGYIADVTFVTFGYDLGLTLHYTQVWFWVPLHGWSHVYVTHIALCGYARFIYTFYTRRFHWLRCYPVLPPLPTHSHVHTGCSRYVTRCYTRYVGLHVYVTLPLYTFTHGTVPVARTVTFYSGLVATLRCYTGPVPTVTFTVVYTVSTHLDTFSTVGSRSVICSYTRWTTHICWTTRYSSGALPVVLRLHTHTAHTHIYVYGFTPYGLFHSYTRLPLHTHSHLHAPLHSGCGPHIPRYLVTIHYVYHLGPHIHLRLHGYVYTRWLRYSVTVRLPRCTFARTYTICYVHTLGLHVLPTVDYGYYHLLLYLHTHYGPFCYGSHGRLYTHTHTHTHTYTPHRLHLFIGWFGTTRLSWLQLLNVTFHHTFDLFGWTTFTVVTFTHGYVTVIPSWTTLHCRPQLHGITHGSPRFLCLYGSVGCTFILVTFCWDLHLRTVVTRLPVGWLRFIWRTDPRLRLLRFTRLFTTVGLRFVVATFGCCGPRLCTLVVWFGCTLFVVTLHTGRYTLCPRSRYTVYVYSGPQTPRLHTFPTRTYVPGLRLLVLPHFGYVCRLHTRWTTLRLLHIPGCYVTFTFTDVVGWFRLIAVYTFIYVTGLQFTTQFPTIAPHTGWLVYITHVYTVVTRTLHLRLRFTVTYGLFTVGLTFVTLHVQFMRLVYVTFTVTLVVRWLPTFYYVWDRIHLFVVRFCYPLTVRYVHVYMRLRYVPGCVYLSHILPTHARYTRGYTHGSRTLRSPPRYRAVAHTRCTVVTPTPLFTFTAVTFTHTVYVRTAVDLRVTTRVHTGSRCSAYVSFTHTFVTVSHTRCTFTHLHFTFPDLLHVYVYVHTLRFTFTVAVVCWHTHFDLHLYVTYIYPVTGRLPLPHLLPVTHRLHILVTVYYTRYVSVIYHTHTLVLHITYGCYLRLPLRLLVGHRTGYIYNVYRWTGWFYVGHTTPHSVYVYTHVHTFGCRSQPHLHTLLPHPRLRFPFGYVWFGWLFIYRLDYCPTQFTFYDLGSPRLLPTFGYGYVCLLRLIYYAFTRIRFPRPLVYCVDLLPHVYYTRLHATDYHGYYGYGWLRLLFIDWDHGWRSFVVTLFSSHVHVDTHYGSPCYIYHVTYPRYIYLVTPRLGLRLRLRFTRYVPFVRLLFYTLRTRLRVYGYARFTAFTVYRSTFTFYTGTFIRLRLVHRLVTHLVATGCTRVTFTLPRHGFARTRFCTHAFGYRAHVVTHHTVWFTLGWLRLVYALRFTFSVGCAHTRLPVARLHITTLHRYTHGSHTVHTHTLVVTHIRFTHVYTLRLRVTLRLRLPPVVWAHTFTLLLHRTVYGLGFTHTFYVLCYTHGCSLRLHVHVTVTTFAVLDTHLWLDHHVSPVTGCGHSCWPVTFAVHRWVVVRLLHTLFVWLPVIYYLRSHSWTPVSCCPGHLPTLLRCCHTHTICICIRLYTRFGWFGWLFPSYIGWLVGWLDFVAVWLPGLIWHITCVLYIYHGYVTFTFYVLRCTFIIHWPGFCWFAIYVDAFTGPLVRLFPTLIVYTRLHLDVVTYRLFTLRCWVGYHGWLRTLFGCWRCWFTVGSSYTFLYSLVCSHTLPRSQRLFLITVVPLLTVTFRDPHGCAGLTTRLRLIYRWLFAFGYHLGLPTGLQFLPHTFPIYAHTAHPFDSTHGHTTHTGLTPLHTFTHVRYIAVTRLVGLRYTDLVTLRLLHVYICPTFTLLVGPHVTVTVTILGLHLPVYVLRITVPHRLHAVVGPTIHTRFTFYTLDYTHKHTDTHTFLHVPGSTTFYVYFPTFLGYGSHTRTHTDGSVYTRLFTLFTFGLGCYSYTVPVPDTGWFVSWTVAHGYTFIYVGFRTFYTVAVGPLHTGLRWVYTPFHILRFTTFTHVYITTFTVILGCTPRFPPHTFGFVRSRFYVLRTPHTLRLHISRFIHVYLVYARSFTFTLRLRLFTFTFALHYAFYHTDGYLVPVCPTRSRLFIWFTHTYG